jgi:hypothetical protein
LDFLCLHANDTTAPLICMATVARDALLDCNGSEPPVETTIWRIDEDQCPVLLSRSDPI